MRKPYIITKLNSVIEYKDLEAKFVKTNPLAFLGEIRVNNTWGDDIVCFDIEPQIEFSLIDESLISDVAKTLTDFGFIITITDVTTELLHGNIDFTNATDDIKTKINEFYFNFFDKDDILDKLSILGTESLSSIDKQILS